MKTVNSWRALWFRALGNLGFGETGSSLVLS